MTVWVHHLIIFNKTLKAVVVQRFSVHFLHQASWVEFEAAFTMYVALASIQSTTDCGRPMLHEFPMAMVQVNQAYGILVQSGPNQST